MFVRGKPHAVSKHAYQGMKSERPPLDTSDIENVLEFPDGDDGRAAWKWLKKRTVIVYYEEDEISIWIRSGSSTRGRLEP